MLPFHQKSVPSQKSPDEQAKQPESTTETSNHDTQPEIVLKIPIHYKENKAFSKWKKMLLILSTDKILRLHNSTTFANDQKKKAQVEIPCSNLELRDVEKSSKPGAILVSIRKSTKTFLLAPIFDKLPVPSPSKANINPKSLEKEKIHRIKGQILQLKEKCVEFGASELDKMDIPKGGIPLMRSLTAEIPITSISNNRSRLECIPVDKWTEDDVQEWLGYVRNVDGKRMKEAYGDLFSTNDISGETLLNLTDQSLKDLGITSLGKRLKLLKEINKLKNNHTYDLSEHYVMSKLEDMNPKYLTALALKGAEVIPAQLLKQGGSGPTNSSRATISQRELEDNVQALYDVETIKKTYLNVEKCHFLDASVSPLLDETEDDSEGSDVEKILDNDDIILKEDSNIDIDSLAEKEARRKVDYEHIFKGKVQDGDEFVEIHPIGNGILGKPTEFLENQHSMMADSKKRIPIKLVITEIMHSSKSKMIRNLLSMTIGGVPALSPTFGMFHTAVIVGPWYLEWTDSSLCIPKRISSSSAILAMDVETLTVATSSLPQIADKLAQLIAEWNVNYTYKNAFKKEKEYNCQDFVEAVLGKLGVNCNTFKGAMKDYLDQMREFGVCEMIFRPTKMFREAVSLEKEAYKFHTHEELDQFVINLKQKYPPISIEFPHEMSLLKAFDRGFWVRHFKDPDREEYKFLSKVDTTSKSLICNCPFKDPRETGTMA